ncbi:S1C family serine protease [Virgibacillus phasianinus]|uniref:S1C family serine protease n=1 Tax=Virgibacillus phasianinus TaxID=2017483 RepID=UPI001FE96FEE|nr:trypsin-like peptidase domain-containing protein [Virgibacillus phasianinus]
MRKYHYIPIAITVFIMILGGIGIFAIHNQWYSDQVTVSSSGINKISNSPQTLNLKTIIHNAEKNVMQIEGQNGDTTITGSGFLYNEKGDIITNAHVVKNADIIRVRTSNARVYPAAIVGISEDVDIAVIRVPQMANRSPIPIEKEIKAELGDEVIALGSPHGFQNTVTLGIISGTERNFTVDGFDYKNVYQISAQITHGNSGGPLINRSTGEVIGINSVGTKDGTIGFSIPLADVIDQIEQWSNEAQLEELKFSTTSQVIDNIDEEAFKEDAAYLINYFLDSIVMRDYISAYTVLGSDMQSGTSYSDFREQYIHVVNLTYKDFTTSLTDNNQIEAPIQIDYSYKQPDKGTTKKGNTSYKFVVGYENDQIKILNITQIKK